SAWSCDSNALGYSNRPRKCCRRCNLRFQCLFPGLFYDPTRGERNTWRLLPRRFSIRSRKSSDFHENDPSINLSQPCHGSTLIFRVQLERITCSRGHCKCGWNWSLHFFQPRKFSPFVDLWPSRNNDGWSHHDCNRQSLL